MGYQRQANVQRTLTVQGAHKPNGKTHHPGTSFVILMSVIPNFRSTGLWLAIDSENLIPHKHELWVKYTLSHIT